MATGVSLDAISKILECAICLGVVSNPKQLACDHSYCKACLDSLLEFQAGGSATIKCPKGCQNITYIPQGQTTNDLHVNYMMGGILEMVKANEKEQDCDTVRSEAHCDCTGCKKDVLFYCFQCDIFTCDSCACHLLAPRNKHEEEEIFIPLSYDREGEINVTCKQHLTNASFLCTEPCKRKAICQYCVHRYHSRHVFESFENVEKYVKEICQQGVEQLTVAAEQLETRWKEVENDISAAMKALHEELECRKLSCLNEYLSFLNEEEEKVKKQFDIVVANQESLYNVRDSIQYCEGIPSKETIKIVLQGEKILSDIDSFNYSVKNGIIREETVSLSRCCFNTKHPLGELNVEVKDVKGNKGKVKKAEEDIPLSFWSKLPEGDKYVNLSKYTSFQDLMTESFPKYKGGFEVTDATPLSDHTIYEILKGSAKMKEGTSEVNNNNNEEVPIAVTNYTKLSQHEQKMLIGEHLLHILKKIDPMKWAWYFPILLREENEKLLMMLQSKEFLCTQAYIAKKKDEASRTKDIVLSAVKEAKTMNKESPLDSSDSLDSNEPLTASKLTMLSKHQQKMVIGERLFPLLKEIQPLYSLQLLIMFLREDNEKLLPMLRSQTLLCAEAKTLLKKYTESVNKDTVLLAVKNAGLTF